MSRTPVMMSRSSSIAISTKIVLGGGSDKALSIEIRVMFNYGSKFIINNISKTPSIT